MKRYLLRHYNCSHFGHMKNRTIILSLILLLPFVPSMAQEHDDERVLICYGTPKPRFNGGDANAFKNWVDKHKCYPEEAKKSRIEGRVTTQFTITKEGKLTKVRILRGVHPLLDEEAIRVIESAPQNWKPGLDYKGEPVDVTYTFPVIFTLSEEDLAYRVLELCRYIPDHVLKPEAKEAMTPEFFRALSEAFDAPVADYMEIGDNEWLWYFVTGNGGSEPVYSLKSVSQTDKDSARAIITVRQKWEDGSFAEEDTKEYEVLLKRANGRWLLDDFDGKKAECLAYVRDVREKYASGKYVKYLKSEKDLRQYIPDFKERVEAFYTKYGK